MVNIFRVIKFHSLIVKWILHYNKLDYKEKFQNSRRESNKSDKNYDT